MAVQPHGVPEGVVADALDQAGAQGVGDDVARDSGDVILGANGQSVVTPAASSVGSTVASSPSSSGIIALTVGLGALGLALFGAGFVAFVRQARRRDVPVTASVRK